MKTLTFSQFMAAVKHWGAPNGRAWGRGRSAWHVYFAETDIGLIKIGRSLEPTKRVQQLRTACGGFFGAHSIRAVVTGGPHTLERDVHALLGRYRYFGEWFLPHFRVLELLTLMKISACDHTIAVFDRLEDEAREYEIAAEQAARMPSERATELSRLWREVARTIRDVVARTQEATA